MFTQAIAEATDYTLPVITSRRLLNGMVQAGLATLFAVNDEGWVLTAAHILEGMTLHKAHAVALRIYLDAMKAIEDDPSLDSRHRRKRIDKLQKDDSWVQNHSLWWGCDGPTVAVGHVDTYADIALLQLTAFYKLQVQRFARFRSSSAPLVQGTSLCRLGFPFHDVASTFDETNGQFKLGAGILPVPRFPLDGILTRDITFQDSQSTSKVECIETSSPGLRGQSGGPIFDVAGRVCALQSKTINMPLGFNPTITVGGRSVSEHQFLNVGIGVHVAELMRFMDRFQVKYQAA